MLVHDRPGCHRNDGFRGRRAVAQSTVWSLGRVIAAVVLSIMLASPVWAGFDEGVAAQKRGDYVTAQREIRINWRFGDWFALD
jgi:hypothetical protein